MSFQKEYAERYDWLVKEFSDWAIFTPHKVSYIIWTTTVLMNRQKNCIVQGMSAFGGISPTYHISLAEMPRLSLGILISLLVMIQMCFSFMLTDSDTRSCKIVVWAFIVKP